MDELKRKIDVLSSLNRKNDVAVEAALKQFIQHREKCIDAKKALLETSNELEACNNKISEGSVAQIDVDSIKLLNKYSQKLNNEIKEKNVALLEIKKRSDEIKKQFERMLMKGRCYSKVIDRVSQEHIKETEKNIDKNAEELWLSKRYKS